MAQKYVRPTVAGWLTPTLLAPWITVYGAVIAYVVLGLDFGRVGKGVALATGLVAGSAWAFVFCTMLVVIDLLLLTVKVRTLPAGKRGWLGALLSPLPALAVYTALPWKTIGLAGGWTIAGAVLAPMLVTAIFTRVFAGQKPPR